MCSSWNDRLLVTLVRATTLALAITNTANAADQTVPGQGNAAAIRLAAASPMVQSAFDALINHVHDIHSGRLRTATLDAITNRRTCVTHRAGVSDATKDAILNSLLSEGLVQVSDAATFPGGLKAGVFPPVLNDGGQCPQLTQAFFSAPGSVFGGHHSYPGGLAVHEAFNLESSLALANGYRLVYGHSKANGLPTVNPLFVRGDSRSSNDDSEWDSDIYISQDIMIAAPAWHDWAKPLVFQWNSDGTEFAEFNFGGNGATDNGGAAGDSRTGAHHILGIAETMKRGLPADFVITQASAHSTPTSGNEFKVVNWLRAAAIVAQIDPVANGYLYRNGANQLRLPPLRRLGSLDLPAAAPGQQNLLAEYVLHNISDSDFTLTGPAITDVEAVLRAIASDFGFDPAGPDYNTRFRNPVFSYLTAERLLILYGNGGVNAVREEVDNLRAHKIL
jgi:hypothetical protein